MARLMESKLKTDSEPANLIERVHISSLTPEIFAQRYQKPGKPVVIVGLLDDVPDWNIDYLCEKLGERKFLLRYYGRQRYEIDKRHWKNIGSGVETQTMPFTEYAKMLQTRQAHENDIYLAKCSISNTPLAATPAFKTLSEKLGLKKAVSDLNMWAGPGGHVECLHYDTLDGTLMQLHGAKKIIMFPPSQMYNLYPFPIYLHWRHGLKLRSWFSQVYPEKPDFNSFPRLQIALQHKYEIILSRGELLYIPAGWWHEVTALGDEMVCSVNRFWSVSPAWRSLFSWGAWRTYLGILFSLPYMGIKLALALFSSHPKENIRKILQMF